MARYLARLLVVTAIEGGLPATGLIFREIEFVAKAFKDVRHGDPDVREKLIDEAGDEQRYAAWHNDQQIVAHGCIAGGLGKSCENWIPLKSRSVYNHLERWSDDDVYWLAIYLGVCGDGSHGLDG
jgi:hypothetical protein